MVNASSEAAMGGVELRIGMEECKTLSDRRHSGYRVQLHAYTHICTPFIQSRQSVTVRETRWVMSYTRSHTKILNI